MRLEKSQPVFVVQTCEMRRVRMSKYSGIGGQAVMEGIMMKNKDVYAVAVRKPDGGIEVKKESCATSAQKSFFTKIPFVRGVFNFIDSLVLGMKTLTYSASFYDEEETPKKRRQAESHSLNSEEEKEGENIEEKNTEENNAEWKTVKLKSQQEKEEEKERDWKETLAMGATVAFSLVLAVGLFMVLPYYISLFIRRYIGLQSETAIVLIEGVFRISLFIGYVALISLMKDIKRVFMYHGAEHKCINCVEHGLSLTPEHVMESSKEHKRCGTSFLLIVMVISIFLFMTIRVILPIRTAWLNVLIRILLLPLIAGISYEFIRLAGRSDNPVVSVLSRPGLWLQRLTTKEPERDMVEVAIAAVEEVFDWKAYLKENFPESAAVAEMEKAEADEKVEADGKVEVDGKVEADAKEKKEAGGKAIDWTEAIPEIREGKV